MPTAIPSVLSPAERRADFAGKNSLLHLHYPQIAPFVFYSDFLFHDMDQSEFTPSIILYNFEKIDEDKYKAKRLSVRIEDLMDYCYRDDVAVNPCGYHNNFPKKVLMRRVYAFVMDIDEVRPATLSYLIDLVEDGRFPRPTAISNSGSGIHFFYILDQALQVGRREKFLQNSRLAQQIYFMLHSRMKQLYADVQKHHLGQDYRVVGSLSKFGDVTTAWETGDFWAVEDLACSLKIDVEEIYKPIGKASPAMERYARSIAQDLGLDLPDFNEPSVVYDFIRDHKDAAYQERERRRAESGQKRRKSIGWYENTWNMVYTKTEAGNRFNAMRALAIVAAKCRISEERFERDLNRLSELWQEKHWKDGDPFNADNVEAIMRMFRNGDRYEKTRSETLEEMLGFKWPGGGKKRANPLPQHEHLELARLRKVQKKRTGTMKGPEGRPSAKDQVRAWLAKNPNGRKCDCIRETGLSKPTVYKWWACDD